MNSLEDRFLAETGHSVYNGNELLIKGIFETPEGVHLLTGYPGSPIATFFDTLGDLAPLLKERGVCVRVANNEALSVAMVNGSQMLPMRSLTAFKSVGGHVAADALALGNLVGPNPQGGAVVVFGDDPWSESTQVPADSRYLCQHLRIPVLEPSTPQEIKDFVPAAFRLSQASGLYMGYILTTILADGGGTVAVGQNHWPEHSMKNPSAIRTQDLDLENTVLLPPKTGRKEVQMPARVSRLLAEARAMGINKITGPVGRGKIGFIVCGAAWQFLAAALEELGLSDRFPVLKMGLTYPLDDHQIAEFAATLEDVIVVEERRAFLETQVAEVVNRARQLNGGMKFANVWGKKFPANHDGFPGVLGMNSSMVLERVLKVLRLLDPPLYARSAQKFEEQLMRLRRTGNSEFNISPRTPTFCPGCPHRDSADTFLEIAEQFKDPIYMRKVHGRKPTDLVFHGDTGCYTMLMFPPNGPLMHNYSGMGLGGATGAGIDPFITNKQVVFMGDSTFFHSGQIAISNSIKAGQDITYVILDNRTTAMTGHQPTPGLDTDILGDPTPRQSIDDIVQAITAAGHCKVIRSNPANRTHYKKLLERTVLKDGVKIIIADKECGIVTNRRKLKQQRAELRHSGFLAQETFMNVTPEICEFCLECTTMTGCPGLNIENTPYGKKIVTDLSWCVSDGACAKLEACPSFEKVVVSRTKPPQPRGHQIKLENLPAPKMRFSGSPWRVHLAGIGGMGIGMAGAILVRAGDHEGFKVLFSDKKGLAIRNGSVFSQITFFKDKDNTRYSQSFPYGSADLLIGLDILEAARALDPKGLFRVALPDKTSAVLNVDKAPTILTLCNRDDFSPGEMEKIIRQRTRPDGFFSHNITSICERLFGTKLYANITMLGLAYQQGLIPVSLESLETAIRETIRVDFKKNMRAFNLGRKLAAHPELFTERPTPKTIARVVREKANILQRTRIGGPALARQYKYLVYSNLRACRELDKMTMIEIARRLYDLVQYESLAYAQEYMDRVKTIYRRDRLEFDFAVTQSVVLNLFKLMLIKDEFYVAAVLTSYEKQRRDTHRYNVNFANGDRIRYKRVFHPRILGKKVSIPMPHMGLQVLKRFNFLRWVLPGFHAEDRAFLNWYKQLLDGFSYRNETEYKHFLLSITAVDQVRGYREYRTPTMARARQQAEDILSGLPLTPRDNDQVPPGKLSSRTFAFPDSSLSGVRQPPIIEKLRKLLKPW
jgi:indolepyruvate ferredoxin oxidoreductase